MLEVMLETWSAPQTGTTYRWSVWRDGTRVAMGGPHDTIQESEAEARAFCAARLRGPPDRVTRL
ncbi:MAG: hypothetical protein JO128_01605 [Alphaproteobacteria bacterium]|nr:hypothetical protein [Alphaproteobacteria bacterium]